MTMTQRYAGMLRRHAGELASQPITAEAVRQAARHMTTREIELQHALLVEREALEAAREDAAELLRCVGLEPERFVSEGGRVDLLRVRAEIAARSQRGGRSSSPNRAEWSRGYFCAVAVLLREEGHASAEVRSLYEQGGNPQAADPDDAALFAEHGLERL